MSSPPDVTLATPICRLFGIKYPVILAGMGTGRTGPEIVSAVTNAGGLGVFGGHSMSPEALREYISRLKPLLKDDTSPFGIDLLLPQIGAGARATNHDYTGGQLGEITDVICENSKQCKLFVSAVGVPPKWVVDKLHKHGILVMNMVGAPRHARKAVEVGVDLICAQGTEGGGHTGQIPTSILVPAVVDAVRGAKSPLTGEPVYVIAAGGIYDGRGLAMSLCQGAQGVWVGTRFLASTEASCSPSHKRAVLQADYTDTVVTLVWSGRPQRTWK
ncbi:2-nitropropane dioxygenase, partial [Gonapodya prolifera JEL478]